MKKQKFLGVLMAAALGLGVLAAQTDASAATREEISKICVKSAGGFHYWNKESESFKALTAFVKEATNKKSANFIPVEDRIAVFDLDGTLVCETAPSYFEWMLYLERALRDPQYKPTAEEREYALTIQRAIDRVGIPNLKPGQKSSSLPQNLDVGEATAQEKVFAGMTLGEYDAYVRNFMEGPVAGLKNLKRGEAFYLPMAEVVSYLNANKFKCFIVSGTDRQTLRVLVQGALPIEMDNIIGTDVDYVATHQGDKKPLGYLYQKDGDEVLRGEFAVKNLKMNKVSAIVREIGRQPVLAFGNSSGDGSMFNYTLTGNRHKSLAFALLCDDLQRELGSRDKAESMRKSCEKYGWTPISMRDDWKTIYGEQVKKAR